MKVCSKCHKEKSLDCFYADRSKKQGHMARCKDCHNKANKERRKENPEQENARNKARYWANKHNEQERHLIRKYGVTLDGYKKMLEQQNGKCAICSSKEPEHKRFEVDHCHSTNEVRGLLCVKCNFLLGYADDDEGKLKSAIDYLSSRRLQQK